MTTSKPPEYVLGASAEEIARLDHQAASIAAPTRMLLQAGGIREGMRVLDLGTGIGHVTFAVAELVGPSGQVVGIDQSDALLEVAEQRRAAAKLDNVRFEQADARTFRDAEPFDAVVTRLMLFHLPDAVDVARHHLGALREGGTFVAVDYDLGTAGTEPVVPLATAALAWVEAGFRHAGADPRIGAHLALLLRAAGAAEVESFGIQTFLGPDDPRGPALLAGVVRAVAPAIVASGIATEEEIGLATLQERLTHEMQAANAVIRPPCLAGAWGMRASA